MDLNQRFGNQISGVRNCPNCGVASPVLNRLWVSENAVPRADKGTACRWGIYACTTCGSAVLARGRRSDYSPELGEVVELLPAPKAAHQDIPDLARAFLQQAYDTLHAPDAAGVMAASAVDAMLKSLSYTEGTLYTRINKAVEDRILTQGMADWAHNVRLGANRPRHADAENPRLSPEEARHAVEYAEALGNFLFVLKAQIDRGIERAAQDT